MFLYYFERVLRQAANDPSLTLPYWDDATDPRLAAAFRDQTYVDEPARRCRTRSTSPRGAPTLNAGTAGLAAAATSSANAMQATTRADFEQRLEATPHGAVHCAIVTGGCPNGLMGSVPVAALDPIFYLHHANIDRLYECWLQVDETRACPPAGPSSIALFLRGRRRQRETAPGARHADHQPDRLQLFRRRRRLPAGPGSAVGRPHRPGGSGARGRSRWRRRRAPAGSS